MDGFDAWNVFVCIFEGFKNLKKYLDFSTMCCYVLLYMGIYGYIWTYMAIYIYGYMDPANQPTDHPVV